MSYKENSKPWGNCEIWVISIIEDSVGTVRYELLV
jgi:hypothetical protein